MNQSLTFFAAAIALFRVTGCASTKQTVPGPDQSHHVDDPAKARLYVIRNPLALNLASRIVPIPVVDNGTEVGRIAGRSFVCWEREPGPAAISFQSGTNLEVRTEASHRYYILQRVRPAGFTPNAALRVEPVLVNEGEGLRHLKSCNAPKP